MSERAHESVPHRHRVDVDVGVQIAYLEVGEGPALLFVPGWTMSGEVFGHQLDELGSGYRVIAVDPRSQGESSAVPMGNTYQQQGVDLNRLIDLLDLHDLHLLGWSYGSLACYAYVEQFGIARLRSFTAIDMSPRPFRPEGNTEWAEGNLHFYLDEYLTPLIDDPERLAQTFIDAIVSRQVGPQDRNWLMTIHRNTHRSAAASLLVSAMVSDYRQTAIQLDEQLPYANITSPEWSEQARAWLTANAPHASVWDMPSHLGFWEKPTEFNARLTEFAFCSQQVAVGSITTNPSIASASLTGASTAQDDRVPRGVTIHAPEIMSTSRAPFSRSTVTRPSQRRRQ